MALCNCGIAISQHGCNGAADDVTAAEDNSVRACDRHIGRFQKPDDRARGAGGEEWFRCTGRQVADVVRVETAN